MAKPRIIAKSGYTEVLLSQTLRAVITEDEVFLIMSGRATPTVLKRREVEMLAKAVARPEAESMRAEF